MNKGQTKKHHKQQGVPVSEVPFTASEVKALNRILQQPYWARAKMKERFVQDFLRLRDDVDEYIAQNGKRKPKQVTKEAQPPSIGKSNEPITMKNKRGEPLIEYTPSDVPMIGFKIGLRGKTLIIEIDSHR